MSEEVQEHEAEQAQEAKPSPGLVLLNARERLGLSVTDVARQLRLSTRQIEAIEADDYERLPGKTFLRGFIRNYAKLLQLDPEPLLGTNQPESESQAIVVPTSKIEFGGKHRFLPFSNHSRKPLPIFVIVAAVALMLVSWGAYELVQWLPESSETKKVVEETSVPAQGDKSPASEPQQTQEDGQPLPLPLPAPAENAAPAVPSAAPLPLAAAPVQTPAAVPLPMPTPAAPPVPAVQAPTPPAAAPAPTAVPPASAARTEENGKKVEFVFEDEAWVQVKDKNGRILFSQLNPKGSRQTVQGTPPFSLIVGNASYVKVTYNDKSIDLSPHAKMNVARLTLE